MADRWPEYEQARRATRRQFLLIGGGSVAAVATLGGLVATPLLRRGPYPAPSRSLSVLSDMDAQVLRAVVGVVFGQDVDPDPIVERIDRSLDKVDPALRNGLTTAFPFLEGGGFVFGGRLQPFTELPPDAQAALFDRWSGSHVLVCRQTTALLEELVILHHLGPGAS